MSYRSNWINTLSYSCISVTQFFLIALFPCRLTEILSSAQNGDQVKRVLNPHLRKYLGEPALKWPTQTDNQDVLSFFSLWSHSDWTQFDRGGAAWICKSWQSSWCCPRYRMWLITGTEQWWQYVDEPCLFLTGLLFQLRLKSWKPWRLRKHIWKKRRTLKAK